MNSIIKNYIKPSVPIENRIHPLISGRWSPRTFSNKRITEEDLSSLFEAARWAASSMNEQPWRFIYAYKGEKEFDLIAETLMEGNRVWAKEASVLMISIYKEHFSKNDKENKAALHDLGQAVANLSIQATQLGIGIHQMGGFLPAKAEEYLNIPAGYSAFSAIALGYFGIPDQLEEPFKSREQAMRTRKGIKEFIFHGKFNLKKE